MSYYPVLLNLRGRPCVVVGGGPIATGKAEGLLEAGALVTVIAPEVTPTLAAQAQAGRVTHAARAYAPGDLAGAALVIAATDDDAVNAQIWRECNAAGILLNAVDDVQHCHFIAPSVLRRGDLLVTISTSGKAPALAVRLRERLEPLIGEEYARFLDLAGALRETLARRYPSFEARKAIWYQLVDSDVLELLRRGDEAGARRRAAEITGVQA